MSHVIKRKEEGKQGINDHQMHRVKVNEKKFTLSPCPKGNVLNLEKYIWSEFNIYSCKITPSTRKKIIISVSTDKVLQLS